jgi:hypothetical protein
VKTQLYQIISICAITASFVPIILVSIKRLWKEPAFLFIAIYWMISGFINLIDKIPGITARQLEVVTVVYNMFDIPIVLGIIFYTSRSAMIRRFTSVAAPALLLAQLASFTWKGWNYDAAKYILAAGLLVILVVVVWEISLYMQKLKHNRHEKAMIFIYVSWLFSYGTFIIVYIFDYYVNASGYSIENLIIYYISTFVAILIALCGYIAKSSKRNFI